MAPAREDDDDLILRAEQHHAREEYILAADLLKQVDDVSALKDKHKRIIGMADRARLVREVLLRPPEEGWIKQGETHGHRDTAIYYKVNPDDTSILCRIETPIEQSLLIPLISVLNESELFTSWMPSFKHPKLGVQSADKLKEMGRGNQIIDVMIAMPIGFSRRQCIQHAFAVNSIRDDNAIIIKAESKDTGTFDDELEIPPPARGVVRVDFDAGFLIRPCPSDHPLLRASNVDYHGESMILLSVTQTMNAHVGYVPMALVNFFTRTVLGRMWGSLLAVAEGVRDGQREAHAQAIAEKEELYKWVEEQILIMFDRMEEAKTA